MMLWLLTWHCYFVAFHVSSHNNVMSESQTWNIDLLFMFQCEGSNSHIETYKSCISAWVIISFLDFYGTTIYRQFCVWIIFAILTTVPVRMLRIKFLLVFCDMLNHVLNLMSPKCMYKTLPLRTSYILSMDLSK